MDDLIARCLAGDGEAADQLCRRYQVRIREYVIARGASPADADDLAQDTLIAALDGLGRGRRPERLTWWLLGIARNLHRHWRGPGPAGLDLPEEAVRLSGPGARTLAMKREMNALLERSLSRLSPSDRELLQMLHREGLDRKEISRRLGVAMPALHARCERAHARLREAVEGHFTTVAQRRLKPVGPSLEGIRGLRPAFRQVLQAMHLEGLSEQEACRKLGLPEATLRARLRGAYASLKCGPETDYSRAREAFEAEKV
jgi:RNA polymerase sigma-70 factor (ECF subfamily)